MREKINKSLLFSILAIVAIVAVLFLAIYLVQKPRSEDADELISIEITAGDMQKSIRCWMDEVGELYAFLPSDTENITLLTEDGYSFTAGELNSGVKYAIADVEADTKHECLIRKNGKNVIETKITFIQSDNIPSLFIETESGSMDYIHAEKGNKEKGSYSVISPDKDENASGNLVEFAGRGNTSWTGCDKKGYKLVMDEACSLLGLDASYTYLLVANARCNYLSNTVAFWISEQMGIKYVPECKHVDLYLNGEYAGNYILCEQIRVSKDSIDIADLNATNLDLNPGQDVKELVKYQSSDGTSKGVLWQNEPEDVTGGYFLERDVPEYYSDEVSGFVLSSGDHYVIKGPKYAGQKEVEYISDYMQQTYDAVSSDTGYNPDTGIYYAEYLDIDSFALKYVLEEFLNFNDAGRSSAYYYKDKGGKLYAGPGWDFEGAFIGRYDYITELNSTSYSTDMYERLLKHSDFREAVISKYRDLLLPALDTLLKSEMAEMQALIAKSAEMDEIRWNRESFSQSSSDIKEWIEKRISFLNSHWLEDNDYVSVTVKSEWQNNVYVYLTRGQKLSSADMPVYERDGFTFGGWIDQDGELYDFDNSVESDITLEALWISDGGSLITSLLGKARQVIPEIIFALVFGIAFLIFVFKFIIRVKKK